MSLLPFTTTGFSAFVTLKTKYTNNRNVGPDLADVHSVI